MSDYSEVDEVAESNQRDTVSPMEYNPVYAWSVVLLFVIAYSLSFLDRQILSLLVEPIKGDLHVSDTQIGLLQGLAFSLFYAILGIPIGRFSDNSNRRNIITIGVFFWSLMTMVCGFAKNYTFLFLARMGVGVGEAALSPAAYSIMADIFPKERLGAAMGVYGTGIFVGAGISMLLGGVMIEWLFNVDLSSYAILRDLAGWQLAFLLAGAPGLLLAVVLYIYVREPVRRFNIDNETEAKLSLSQTFDAMKKNFRPLMAVYIGSPLHGIIMYSLLAWVPTYFIRTYGWTVGDVGLTMGSLLLVFGSLGVVSGGVICDWLFKKKINDAPIVMGMISCSGAGLFVFLSFYLPVAPEIRMMILGGAFFFLALLIGPNPAAIQLIVANRIRGQSIAVFIFMTNLIGLTLGPLLPALVSDKFFQDETQIGTSLEIVGITAALLAFIVFYIGRKAYRDRYHQIYGNK